MSHHVAQIRRSRGSSAAFLPRLPRWRMERWLCRLVPLFLLLVVATGELRARRAEGLARTFVADESYASLCVARTLAADRLYGTDAYHRAPAARDTVWRFLLAGAGHLAGSGEAGALVLGLACGIATLLLLANLAWRIYPSAMFSAGAGCLYALGPGVVPGLLNGTAAPLLALLVTLACWLHFRGLSARRIPLGGWQMLVMAVAINVRVELAMLWLLLVAHSFLTEWIWPRRQSLRLVARALAGILAMTAALLPALLWNLRMLGVYWPPTLGAPLTLDIWSELGFWGALGQTLERGMWSASAMFAVMVSSPLWTHPLTFVAASLGAGWLALQGLKKRDRRAWTLVGFTLVGLPVLHALTMAYVGPATGPLLAYALLPLTILALAAFIFRAPAFLWQVFSRRSGARELACNWPGMAALGLLAGLLMFAGLDGRIAATRQRVQLARVHAVHQTMQAHLQSGRWDPRLVATDAPGWVLYRRVSKVLDLTGELDPVILTCLDAQGQPSLEYCAEWFKLARPSLFVFWKPSLVYLAQGARTVHIPGVFPEDTPDVWIVKP